MNAIETKYNGYRFRSRLEARWAVFFDCLHVNWDYELEGFEVPNAGYYLPDFYFPRIELFVDVKPNVPDLEERKRFLQFSCCLDFPYQFHVLVKVPTLWPGFPRYCWHILFQDLGDTVEYIHPPVSFLNSISIYDFWEDRQLFTTLRDFITSRERFTLPTYGNIYSICMKLGIEDPQAIETATIAARSARFEHGENPLPHTHKPWEPIEDLCLYNWRGVDIDFLSEILKRPRHELLSRQHYLENSGMWDYTFLTLRVPPLQPQEPVTPPLQPKLVLLPP